MQRPTNLSETHLVSKDPVLAFAPKVRKPIQPSELEILELAPCGDDVLRVLDNLLEGWSLVAVVRDAFEGELGLRFSLPVLLDLLLRNGSDFLLSLPGAVVIVEARPLAVVLRARGDGVLSVGHYPFHGLESLKLFPFSLFVQEKRLVILARHIGSVEPRLIHFVCLDVIVDTLETSEPLEKFISLICVVQMREILPLDMEALRGWNMREQAICRSDMTYDVVEPKIFGVVFSTLFSAMAEDGLNLVLLFVGHIRVDIVC
jgi:hypothetical protein